MSLINLLAAARTALARHRQRRRAYHELMSLDDRSLADIGLHRSQISALVEGIEPRMASESTPDAVVASVFGGASGPFAASRPHFPYL